jgi:hypothetical protein
MELSHLISDAVLTAVGLYVFFCYLLKLDLATSILWEAFILSVTAAAFFGVFRFAGIKQAMILSELFQQVAASVGAICLVFAAFSQISQRPISKNMAYLILAVGFALFAYIRFTGDTKALEITSLICIPAVILIGIWGLFTNQKGEGSWLILGVVALVFATYNKYFMPDAILNSTDVYHYLVAIALFCFGMAAKHQVLSTNK